MASTDALQARINAYSAGLQPPALPEDPVVLTSALTASLATKLDLSGDASNNFVKAPGNPSGQPLSQWLTSPLFLASSSPVDTDAYASGRGTGKAAFSVNNTDSNSVSGKERYSAFFSYTGGGTGDASVIGSSFGIGASALKKNWFNSTVRGQMIGANIVVRNGYFGSDANAALSEYGGYNPAGDATGIIVNSVQASPYGQNAAAELSIHYAKNGQFDSNGNVHSINVQIAPMRMLNPDSSAANPGIGLALTASAGSLGYAIQAVNTARPGSYNNDTPGIWGGFLRYNLDDGGTRPPFDAFRVDQDGSIVLSSGTGATPQKRIRAGDNGTVQILNNADQLILQIGDNGSIYIVGLGTLVIDNKQVIAPQQPAIANTTDTSNAGQTLNTLLQYLRNHGLIAS